MCCYVVVTCRSSVWLAVSVVALVLQLAAILSPTWLIGEPPLERGVNATRYYAPSVGIYSRCTKIGDNDHHCASFSFNSFATDSSVYPSPWKAAMFFLSLCAANQFMTVLAGVLACCLQAICKKSVISLAGAVQALAGVFGVIGFLLYPWGWGATRVERLCGPSEPFIPGKCSIGWALYACAAGIALTFIASGLSKPADRAANSDKVQFQIDEGRQLICLA